MQGVPPRYQNATNPETLFNTSIYASTHVRHCYQSHLRTSCTVHIVRRSTTSPHAFAKSETECAGLLNEETQRQRRLLLWMDECVTTHQIEPPPPLPLPPLLSPQQKFLVKAQATARGRRKTVGRHQDNRKRIRKSCFDHV